MKRELFSFSSFLSLLLSVLLLAPTFGGGAEANATVTVSEEKTLVYVSQNGSDTSDGTKETPFLTLAAAVRALNGKNGTVVLLDTAFWSQNKKTPLVPNHTGVVTFRGETRDAVLDFSAQSEKSADAADMLLSGDTVLENLTLRTHFNKSLFTNGHDLTLSDITYRSGEKEAPFDLVIGRYSAVCAGSSVSLKSGVALRNVYVGYNLDAERQDRAFCIGRDDRKSSFVRARRYGGRHRYCAGSRAGEKFFRRQQFGYGTDKRCAAHCV